MKGQILDFQNRSMQLSHNKILITGATQGIGLALAQKLSSLNNEIVAVGRNSKKLEELSQKDSNIFPFQCDLNEPDAIQKMEHFISSNHPDLNVLINNAGIQYNYVFNGDEEIQEKINSELNVNVLVPMQLINALIPVMQRNESLAIVNVSSGLGFVPKASAPVYCASKAAIHIFTKSLRYQLPQFKIFEIIPPLVDTQMTKGRGNGKISPQQLVAEFISAFEKDRLEINIHKVKLLRIIQRLSPVMADKIMRGVTEK